MTSREPNPLKDALDLETRIKTLKALLELQRQQIEMLNGRLYSGQPGGVAAKRLLSLQQRDAPAPPAAPISRSRR